MKTCLGKLDALFRQTAPDESEGGVKVFFCAEANCRGGKMGDLTGLDPAEQSVLLHVLDETCENDVANVIYAAVLREEAAAADESGDTVISGEKIFAGRGFIQNLRDGGHLLTAHGDADLYFPEMDRRVFAEARPFNFRVVDGLAHGAAMETVIEVEQSCGSAIDELRGLATTLGGRILLCD